MGVTGSLRKGFRLLFYPARESKGNYGIGRSVRFLYTAAIFGLALALAVSAALYASGAGTFGYLPFSSSSAALPFPLYALALAVALLVALPAGAFLDAALLQLFSKHLFHVIAGGYERTFAAVAASSVPFMLLYFLYQMPFVSMALAVIFAVWSFIILVVALSVQQGVSRLRALGAVLATMAITFAIALAVFVAFFAAGLLFATGLLGSSLTSMQGCLSEPGFICQGAAFHDGTLSLTFGQASGSDWGPTSIVFVPYGSTYPGPGGYSGAPRADLQTVASGRAYGLEISLPAQECSQTGSHVCDGTLYANYTIDGTSRVVRAASLEVKPS